MKQYLILLLFVLLVSPTLSCYNFDHKINNYKFEGEEIVNHIIYDLEGESHCVYFINNQKDAKEPLFIVLNSQGKRVKEKEVIIRAFIALKTKEYVDKEYQNLEKSFDNTYDKLRELKVESSPYYNSLEKALKGLQGEYLDICFIPIPQAKWIEICVGDVIQELIIEEQCKLVFTCLDWLSTIKGFEGLRGNIIELKSDNVIYQDEIDRFYETLETIPLFLGEIDKLFNQNLVSSFSYTNFRGLYDQNYQDSIKANTNTKKRVGIIKDELIKEIDSIINRLGLIKEDITNYQKEGYKLKDQYKEICKIKDNIPKRELFDEEEFTKIKNSLEKTKEEITTIESNLRDMPKKRHNILERLYSRIILSFLKIRFHKC